MEMDASTMHRPRAAAARRRFALRPVADRPLPLWADMSVVALVILVWQAARIPLEGSLAVSLAHARDWLQIERALYIDIEADVLRLVHEAGAVDLLWWLYWNLHLPVLFVFMALTRLRAPDAYPRLRTAFLLSHVPAVAIIGLYPLLPPRWLPGMPFAVPAPADLNGTLHNATAAAASQHVGYPIFIAAATIWIARSRLAWVTLAYPVLVLVIVVGTGNHYVLDGVVGGLCAAFGFAAARLLHGRSVVRHPTRPAAPLAQALLAAAGYASFAHAINTASGLRLPPHVTTTDVLLVGGLAAIAAARGWARRGSGGARPSRGPVAAQS